MASPIIAAFLFGVEPLDPLTYVGVGGLFLLITVLAGYLPARRVLKVDPVLVLTAE